MDDVQLDRVGLTMKLTPRSVTVLRLAQEIAGRHGHAFIGTEHLLLALIEEGDEGIAGQVLHEIGAADEARRRTEERLDAAAVRPRHLTPVLHEEARLQLIAMNRSQRGAWKSSMPLLARPSRARARGLGRRHRRRE